MSVARSAIMLICLLLLLTWLSWRAINPQAEQFDRVLDDIDHLSFVQDALYRDVFAARTGLLRNYDPLVRDMKSLHESVSQLRGNASLDNQTSESVHRLEAAVARQEDLVELFKRQNAVLHNSLSFFGWFAVHSDVHELAIAVGAAAAAILHLTIDTSPEAIVEATTRLEDLRSQSAKAGQAAVVQPFLAHGQLLQRLLPSVDNILIELTKLTRKPDQDDLRKMILARQLAFREQARVYRAMLYVASLGLVALLSYLGIQLRERADDLQRRAAIEHLLAEISMKLVGAAPEDLEAEINRAIGLVGNRLGCDRAYLVVSGAAEAAYRWYRSNAQFTPGWPEAALDLAMQLGSDRDGAINVPYVSRLSGGRSRSLLERFGVAGWACATAVDRRGKLITLGLDVVGRKGGVLKPGERVLLRTFLDTFIHAINRGSAEEERARLHERMQQTSRMETIGAFASGIAHNFNNILGGILGYVELMEEDVSSRSSTARHLSGLRRSAERARDLVNHILAFGRYREIRRSPVDIAALATETILLLRVSLTREIELTVRPNLEGSIVRGEGAQLQQILMNLCQNAANAMAPQGRIQVILEAIVTTESASLSHAEVEPGRYVRISVIDEGEGMDAVVLDRLFEPFFTTRPEGNGLGLATVREIVREHGGGIDVQSWPGAGSKFEVWLPLASAEVWSARERPNQSAMGRGEVVMLVAADKQRLLGEEEKLAALGYEAVGFSTVEGAKQACLSSRDRFDVVVVGQVGTLAQTYELTTELRQVLPTKPIILAARMTPELSTEALVEAGISDVVRWPILTEEIAVVLSQVSERYAANGSAAHHDQVMR